MRENGRRLSSSRARNNWCYPRATTTLCETSDSPSTYIITYVYMYVPMCPNIHIRSPNPSFSKLTLSGHDGPKGSHEPTTHAERARNAAVWRGGGWCLLEMETKASHGLRAGKCPASWITSIEMGGGGVVVYTWRWVLHWDGRYYQGNNTWLREDISRLKWNKFQVCGDLVTGAVSA
ncbi:hypothetical protein K504DRAFT_246655 [Pleomassaria siparia CBS 279.74]|uniref:Uncharacterized protein n=1 Tax=Pleomassaria siparia CBS 279.74 TaxID=1314801 RepID=A0A6G1KB91_9PLEO|nr:hypothetical protein K504DRAFT_246655 [Pleomassaria siparia CBS 279.74]